MKSIIHGLLSFTIVAATLRICGDAGLDAKIAIAGLAVAQYVNGFAAAFFD